MLSPYERGKNMDREQIYTEMKKTIGVVPLMFKSIPDDTLELEWNLFKRTELEEGVLPGKYRELIGLGIAAVTKCKYCTYFHTEVAKMYGATDAEIENALLFAKSSIGWSTYVNGLQIDMDTFKKEIKEVRKFVSEKK
jgi:AhpD family alkylhydroperoxidase